MGRRTNTAVWLDKYKRWQIKVQKDGERRTFTSSTPGRNGQRECNRKADEWLDDGISGTNRRMCDYFEMYVADLKQRTSRSNWSNEQTYGKVWILPEIGHLKIANVTDQHLQNVINKAFAAGLARKTLLNIRSTITSLFRFCRKCKATTYHPEDIVIPNGAPVGIRTIVQPDDLKKLMSSDMTTYRDKPIIDKMINAYRLQVVTGLRPGELLGLKWGDVQHGMIAIRQSVNVFGEITVGKNKNAIRSFAQTTPAKNVLRKQWEATAPAERGNDEFIFPRMPEQTYLRWWKRYCRANGIPETTLYELRHTFVSIVQRLPEAQVKMLVGHSKSMDTFGVYGHEVAGVKEEIASQVDSVFGWLLNPEKTVG